MLLKEWLVLNFFQEFVGFYKFFFTNFIQLSHEIIMGQEFLQNLNRKIRIKLLFWLMDLYLKVKDDKIIG